MAERAGHRPPGIDAWLALVMCMVLLVPILAAGRAQATPFAAVVMDARTGEILHAVNETTRLHPASLTKMMTLYVAFEAIRNGEISLDTRVRISRRAAAEPPSRLGLREGQRIAFRHLIRAAALRSGNDAATAIAEAVSGSVDAFSARMNRTAAALGMSQTRFRNAHGLTESGHLSSARDMSILGRQLYFDYPEYYNLFSRRTEDAGIATVRNTNSRFLDSYRGADGIKTGFTRAAGYNLTASAERNGVRIIVTVFGGRSVQHRHDQIVALMDRGFRAAPARVAVRRPARPDYTRVPQVATAGGDQGGRTAGRVIRLQTAPARSIFPQARPLRGEPVPEALIAAVQGNVESTLAALAAPADDPDLPEQAADVPMQRGAPARSLRPTARPEAILAAVTAAGASVPETEIIAEDVASAVAAGFTVIDQEELEAVTEIAARAITADVIVPGDDESAGGAIATAPVELPSRALEPPQERPEALAQVPTETVIEAPEAAVDLLAVALEDVEIGPDRIVLPGLPPIPVAGEAVASESAPAEPRLAALEPSAAAAVDAPEGARPHGQVEDGQVEHGRVEPATDLQPEPVLTVTADGQILWRDEDLLHSLDEVATRADAAVPIVLTSADSPAASPPAVLPEIVVRVASSGGQLWGVDLGRYGSRFDAERTLLRVALAESATLGGGVRRVVDQGGGFRARVLGLTQDQARRACLRLEATAQDCAVVEP